MASFFCVTCWEWGRRSMESVIETEAVSIRDQQEIDKALWPSPRGQAEVHGMKLHRAQSAYFQARLQGTLPLPSSARHILVSAFYRWSNRDSKSPEVIQLLGCQARIPNPGLFDSIAYALPTMTPATKLHQAFVWPSRTCLKSAGHD